jgi:WD40 repeat protein
MSTVETIAQQAAAPPPASTSAASNPYVGPRPFERRDEKLFFGRDREARDLVSFILANRVFVLYSQSGAGKSSLLNTKVVSGLENEHCRVLPIARVQGKIPTGVAEDDIRNIFSLNVIWSLRDRVLHLPAQSLSRLSLAEVLAEIFPKKPGDEIDDEPIVLIFDQFEELFSFYEYRWQDRAAFLQEVLEALAAVSQLNVVFSLREDYIAKLDASSGHFPNKLRARYQLERLRETAALEAISSPAAVGGRSYAEGVPDKIVRDLLETYSPDISGKPVKVRGEFVEPVQLQVVCSNLWIGMPPNQRVISEQQLQQSGSVDEALRRFYDASLAAIAAKTRVSELEIRRWIERALVTSAGTRGTVFRDTEKTAGMPNQVVQELEDCHLIRGDWRAGAQWYEITHDRLLRPIRESNRIRLDRARRAYLIQLGSAAVLLVALSLAVVAWSILQSHQVSQRADAQLLALSLAEASSKLPQRRIDLGLLLAVEAYRAQDLMSTRSNLLSQVLKVGRIDRFIRLSSAGDLVTSIAVSGKDLIASVTSDRSLLVWNRTGEVLLRAPLNGDAPFSLFADGSFIYAIPAQGGAQVFDVVRGNVGTVLAKRDLLERLKSAPAPSGPTAGPSQTVPDLVSQRDPDVHRTVALASERLLAARGGEVVISDVGSGAEIARFQVADNPSRPVKVTDVGLSPDGKFAFALACEIDATKLDKSSPSPSRFSACAGRFVKFWQIDGKHELSLPGWPSIPGISASYVALGSSAGALWMAIEKPDGSVDVGKYRIEADSGSAEQLVNIALSVALPIADLVFSDDATRLVSVSGNQAASWRLDGPSRLERKVHDGVPLDLATAGDLIASIGRDGYAVIGQTDGREVFTHTNAPPPDWKDDRVALAGVALLSGKLLAAQYGTIALWDTGSKQNLLSIKTDPAAVVSVAIDPLGKYVAAGFLPPAVRDSSKPETAPNVAPIDYTHVPVLWNAADGKPALFVDLSSPAPKSSPGDQNQPAAPDSPRKATDGPQGDRDRMPQLVVAVAFSPDGKNLVVTRSGEADGGVDFYARNEASDGFIKSPLPFMDGPTPQASAAAWIRGASFVAYSGDGKLLAISQDDNTIIYSKAKPPRQIATRGSTSRLAISPDNGLLVTTTGSGDTLTLWDIERGTQFGASIRVGNVGGLSGVAFSPDNRQLFTADGNLDGMVSYDLSVPSWIRQACEIAGRELTSDERATYQLPADGPKTCAPEPSDRDSRPTDGRAARQTPG